MNISGNTTKIGLPEGSPKNFVAEKEGVTLSIFSEYTKRFLKISTIVSTNGYFFNPVTICSLSRNSFSPSTTNRKQLSR